MTILFTTDQIFLHGGIEKVMAEKANYFADVYGYKVIIMTTEQKHNPPRYLLSKKIILVDIEVNYIRTKSYFHPLNLLKTPSHFRRLNKTLSKYNPNVIINCNFAFDFYWMPFIFRKISKFKEYHSSRYLYPQLRLNIGLVSKLIFFINDFIESKYTKLIVLNQDETKYFRSKNSVVIPNPISIKESNYAKLQNKKAIAAGRIAPVKGFENAILAWKKVVINNPDWELHIYGQGEENYISQLLKLIRISNLDNNVFIKDAVSNLETVMQEYSIYIMTSQTECFPMVLLESLAAGLPIVSFDCPHGPKNIITNNQDGFIVENQNNDALAEKICFLINNQTLRLEMGKNAKQNSKRFDKPIVMENWNKLFNCVE